MTTDQPAEKLHPTVLDSGGLRIAQVYAQSLYEVARKLGMVDAVIEEFDSLMESYERLPGLRSLFASAVVARRDKDSAIRRVFEGRCSSAVLNFLRVLNDHGRLTLIPVIGRVLHGLHRKQIGHVAVEVRSATELDETQLHELRQSLRARLGSEPDLSLIVEPSLLGGLIVRVGDTVYDGSVRKQIARLRDRFVERSKHEIQSRRDQFSTAT